MQASSVQPGQRARGPPSEKFGHFLVYGPAWVREEGGTHHSVAPADDLLWAGRRWGEEKRDREDRQHGSQPPRQTKLRGNINTKIFHLIKIFDKI